jgi:uncharacterized protein YndB with AHSA1/START domain
MSELRPLVAHVQRLLPATPDEVFDEWIDPDAMAEWMCPRPAHATGIQLDPRAGGRLRIDIEEEGVQFFIEGRFLELDWPRRLRFTWSCSTWANPAHESVVTVTLEPHDDAHTLMTIRHELLPDEHVATHERGWTLIAEQLAGAL